MHDLPAVSGFGVIIIRNGALSLRVLKVSGGSGKIVKIGNKVSLISNVEIRNSLRSRHRGGDRCVDDNCDVDPVATPSPDRTGAVTVTYIRSVPSC
jgi:hypothetical protein